MIRTLQSQTSMDAHENGAVEVACGISTTVDKDGYKHRETYIAAQQFLQSSLHSSGSEPVDCMC